jgi:hypothetical protein
MSAANLCSGTHYDILLGKLGQAHSDLPSQVQSALNEYEAITFVLSPAIGFAETCSGVMSKLAVFLEQIGEYLADSWRIPIDMYGYYYTWQGIQAATANLSMEIDGQVGPNVSEWGGVAGGAYANGVQLQGPAVYQVSEWAGDIALVCQGINAAGATLLNGLIAAAATIYEECASAIPATPWAISAIILSAIATASSLGTNFSTTLQGEQGKLSQVLAGGYPFTIGVGQPSYDMSWPPATSS